MHPNLSFHHDFPPKADSWYGRFEDNVPGSCVKSLFSSDFFSNLGAWRWWLRPRDQGGHGVKKGSAPETPWICISNVYHFVAIFQWDASWKTVCQTAEGIQGYTTTQKPCRSRRCLSLVSFVVFLEVRSGFDSNFAVNFVKGAWDHAETNGCNAGVAKKAHRIVNCKLLTSSWVS